MSKLYIKDDVVKPIKKIVIYQNGQQIINPTEEMLFSDGWTEYVIPEPSDEEKLRIGRQDKINEIYHFDSSASVNEFYISDSPIWLDKATRVGLMLRFQAEKEAAKENTTLWNEGVKYELNIDVAMQMLNALELYASACYDNTQYHISQVNSLETLDEIESYDYTVGYPDKLMF